MANALAIDLVKEKGECSIYLVVPGEKPKFFREHMYPAEVYVDNNGYFFAEDLLCVEHFNRTTGEVTLDDPSHRSGFGYYPFFRYHGEVCQIFSGGIVSGGTYFAQLTKNGLNVLPEDIGFPLDPKSYGAVVDSENNLYVSAGNSILMVRTIYQNREIKKVELVRVGERVEPVVLYSLSGKVYDFSGNSVHSTDDNKEVFRTESGIIDMEGIDTLLCSTKSGDVFDVLTGKVITKNTFPTMLVRHGDKIMAYNEKRIQEAKSGDVVFDPEKNGLEGVMVKAWSIRDNWLFTDDVLNRRQSKW